MAQAVFRNITEFFIMEKAQTQQHNLSPAVCMCVI